MTVIHPETLEEAVAYRGEFRGGGTDVEARRGLGLVGEVTIDLRRIPGLRGIERTDEGTRIGAMTRVASVARDLAAEYPTLASTAASLANPHNRAVATVGGNLLQHSRCWYYRTGDVDCFKTGSDGCPARTGFHHFGNVFDTSSCVAPHPSSLALALLLHDAEVSVHPARRMRLVDLFDPVDPTREHTLDQGEVLTEVLLAPPVFGERGAYWRIAARSQAEWPLVEAACRLSFSGDSIAEARVGIGGVGPTPVRLTAVEEALRGAAVDRDALAAAAGLAGAGTRPAPQAAYKVRMMTGAVMEVLERAVSGLGAIEPAVHERPL
ncbi:MAG TPA: FAD binding domain-containing protein [Acidimicrobiia bacterium]|nr:FAD binding domain-containing protein [Acidimicrobiia bacterium]